MGRFAMRLNGRTTYFARERLRQLSFRRQQLNIAIEALELLQSQQPIAATHLAHSRVTRADVASFGNVVPFRSTQRPS
jgi:hypothetical protein